MSKTTVKMNYSTYCPGAESWITAVACSDGGAGGARHTLALKKKGGGEKDVDLRPHTYVRTRGAKYRC